MGIPKGVIDEVQDALVVHELSPIPGKAWCGKLEVDGYIMTANIRAGRCQKCKFVRRKQAKRNAAKLATIKKNRRIYEDSRAMTFRRS